MIKSPSIEWVWFPKVSWPFSYLTLTQNKPSQFFECYLLFDHYCLTMTDELYVYALYSYANKPNKNPLRKKLLALLLWEIGHLYSPSRSCLGRLILSHGSRRQGEVGRWRPPTFNPCDLVCSPAPDTCSYCYQCLIVTDCVLCARHCSKSPFTFTATLWAGTITAPIL